MLLQPDCIPCIAKMALSSIRLLTDDERRQKDLFTRVLEIPGLRGLAWDKISPEVLEPVMNILVEAFGKLDPFRELKERQNKKALELYPALKRAVEKAQDPLFAAVNLAIWGNSVDVMVTDRSIDVAEIVKRELDNASLKASYCEFRQRLERTHLLLYLGDNSGEVVFDRLLIETIKKFYAPQIVFVVRGAPALNDVTLKEAAEVGMDSTATVISNGMTGLAPGTILSRCSAELNELFETSDLVISKGGANFDSLEEVKDRYGNLSFLLIAKCPPYSKYFTVELHQPVLANFFKTSPRPDFDEK
ncbi:MAG: ARMT1-like domain-containing protein [Syntrophobacteraceae bacterium]|nr:ARMT1-like domain-containing protein [Syntrophobacteraceae bacterium]